MKVKQVAALVCRLTRETRAYIALAFSFSLIPTIGLFALVIDYGVMSRTKAQLDSAADSAVIAATTATADAYVSNGGNFPNARQQGVSAGLAWYSKQVSATGSPLSSPPPAPSIDITQDSTTFTALLNYTAQSPGSFSTLFGMSSYKIAGSSSSTFTLPGYLDIQILMDTSPSMTIIADPYGNNNQNWSGYSAFVKNNFPGIYYGDPTYDAGMGGYDCVFACHLAGKSQKVVLGYKKNGDPIWNQNVDTYAIAQYYGQNVLHSDLLRIDVLKSAVSEMLQEVSASIFSDHYRIGLYTFNNDASQFYGLSSDFKSASNAVKSVTAYTNPVATNNHTNFSKSMQTMAAKYVNAPGDGLSSAGPKKAVFLITDGVDNNPSVPGGTQAVPSSACDMIKNVRNSTGSGVDIYVLYTTYPKIYDSSSHANNDQPPYNGTYNDLIYSRLQSTTNSAGDDKISAGLKACASSPDKFFYASNSASIQLALSAMMQAAMASPNRFTK